MGQTVIAARDGAGLQIEAVAQHRQQAEFPANEQRRPHLGLAKQVENRFAGVEQVRLCLAFRHRSSQQVRQRGQAR